MFKINEIQKNIFVLEFKKRQDMTSTLLRFQEHYESPEFRNKTFTLKEFKEWYTKNSPNGVKTGKFTYYKDWSGFNFPSSVLMPFYDGQFKRLSKKEKLVLETLPKKIERFYVIGVDSGHKNMEGVLNHELAHAYYFIDEEYKNNVDSIISSYNVEDAKEAIKYTGYCDEVLIDEVNAYSICGYEYVGYEFFPQDMIEKLKKLFDEKQK